MNRVSKEKMNFLSFLLFCAKIFKVFYAGGEIPAFLLISLETVFL